MNSFATRLLESIDACKTSQADLARKAKVKAPSISDWVRGKTKPGNLKAEPLLRAAAFLQVNPMWLLTGYGSRAASAPTVLTVEESPVPIKAWRFEALDFGLVNDLKPDELLRLEGAWILAASQLGFSLAKQVVA